MVFRSQKIRKLERTDPADIERGMTTLGQMSILVDQYVFNAAVLGKNVLLWTVTGR